MVPYTSSFLCLVTQPLGEPGVLGSQWIVDASRFWSISCREVVVTSLVTKRSSTDPQKKVWWMNFRCSLLVGPRCVFFVKAQVNKSSELPSYIDHQLKNSKKLRLQNERSWGFLQWSWDLLHGTKSLVGLIWVEWIYRGKGRIPWVFVSFVFCSEKVTHIDTGGFSIAQCGWVVPWSHFREEQLEWHGQIQVANRLAVSTGSI